MESSPLKVYCHKDTEQPKLRWAGDWCEHFKLADFLDEEFKKMTKKREKTAKKRKKRQKTKRAAKNKIRRTEAGPSLSGFSFM